ncbi:MAG: homoserine dehydrogenase [Mariniblastus sp.]|nr:homoserine dehydrogenase [Mariniblastus sp.]
MEKTEVAIVGLGTVGSGVARLLLDHGDRTARHAGRTLWLSHVVVRDLSRERDAQLPDGLLTDDLQRVIADPNVKVVAQLIGGIEPARSIMLQLLAGGKDIVTANKALLAEHGPELFDRARQLGRSIAFEASVAGGIPIITNISQCLSANQVTSLRGILNGTSNFVVTRMQQNNQPYEKSLHRAQQLGFAEADPTQDVDGSDSAQKLAILAHLGFGARVRWNEIPRRGIDTLDKTDMNYAGQLGYRIKLIAFALNTDQGLQLTVTPMLVEVGKPLAEVRENFNAISVVGDAVGPVFFHGQGAGRMPTASAVVADMIDTAVGRTALTFKTLELWSEGVPRVEMADPGDLRGQFYLRFNVRDEPGVLGQLAGLLGDEEISIASVFQHTADNEDDGVVPVVIMTRASLERNVNKAVAEIEKLSCVFAGTERLRILD